MSAAPSPAAAPAAAPAVVVRRLPTPRAHPPYDDEVTGPPARRPLPRGSVQGTLALAFSLPTGVPATPFTAAALRLVPDPDEEDCAPRPTPRSELPEPQRWTGRLAQAVVEVLAGDRPVAQLVRWTTEDVYEQLRDRTAAVTARAVGERRSHGRCVVRSVRVCEPVDGVVEASATVLDGRRYRALALRLEGLDGRWQCTHFAVV